MKIAGNWNLKILVANLLNLVVNLLNLVVNLFAGLELNLDQRGGEGGQEQTARVPQHFRRGTG